MKQGEMNRRTSLTAPSVDQRLPSHHVARFGVGVIGLYSCDLSVTAQRINRRLIPRQSVAGMVAIKLIREGTPTKAVGVASGCG